MFHFSQNLDDAYHRESLMCSESASTHTHTHTHTHSQHTILGVPGMNLDMPEDRIFVKLIDFGGATWEHDAHPRVVQTR